MTNKAVADFLLHAKHAAQLVLAQLLTWKVLTYLLLILIVIRITVSLLLWIFVPALSIGSLRLFSVGRISWRSSSRSGKKQSGNRTPSDRISVTVGSIGWSFRRGSCSRSDGCAQSGWFILLINDLKVTVPRAWLVSPSPSTKSASPTPSPSTASSSTTASRLHRIHPFLSLFALEVGVELIVEDVLTLKGTVHAGTTIAKPSETDGVRVTSWIALDGLRVVELPPPPPPPDVQRPRYSTPSPPKPTLLPAVSLSERVSVSTSTPLLRTSGTLGRACIDVAVVFGRGKEGVHVRVHELKRILRILDDIEFQRRKNQGPSPAVLLDEDDSEDDTVYPMPNLKAALPPTPLFYIRSIQFTLPLVVVSAHYNTPLHMLAPSSNRPLPRSVGFALTVKAVEGKLWMAGTSDAAYVPKDHRGWIGKDRELALAALFQWGEIAGRVRVDSSEEDILPESNKAFSIAHSSLAITSTWLPPALATRLPLPAHAATPIRNFNDDTLIVEVSIGAVRGHATFETLDSALRIFKGRPRSSPLAHDARVSPEAKVIRGLPRLIGAVTWERFEVRIQAPECPESDRTCGINAEADQFFRHWMSPDVFCISLPNGAVSFGADYRDRSVRRTDAEQRSARRLRKRVRSDEAADDALSTDTSGRWRAASASGSPTDELQTLLGVPPPPTLDGRERQRSPMTPTASDTTELDTRPISYSWRFHLCGDTLNVFLLATNDGSGDPEDATSWLNESNRLPSDPIRFDILAVSAFEISAPMTLLGWVGQNSNVPSVPVLSRSTRSGEVHALIDTIGVDLWRPPVMGAIRDFLTSFAGASATSTLRSVDPVELPAPLPMTSVLAPDVFVYVAVQTLDMRIAGSDPKNDVQACRGIALHNDFFVFEYLLQGSLRPGSVNFAQRQSLDLREDLRVEANAHVAQYPGQRQALVKITSQGFHLDPVVDARSSRGRTRRMSTASGSEQTSDDWELRNRALITDLVQRRRSILPTRQKEAKENGIVSIPELFVRVRVKAKEKPAGDRDDEGAPLDDIVVNLEAESITFRLELFSLYLCLVAFAAVKALAPPSKTTSQALAAPPSPPPHRKRPQPCVSVLAEVVSVHAFLTLPHHVPLYAHVRRLRVQMSPTLGVIAEWDMLLLAGNSPSIPGKWDDIVRFRITTITIRSEEDNSGLPTTVVALVTESARLRIPFRYIFSQIVDNAVNLVKAMKQLIHQHVKGRMDWILEPVIEDAKVLPKVDLKIKMFVVEIQDDPFETRLNIIWRAGYEEQLARIERARAFDEKVEAIRRAEAAGGEPESDDENANQHHHHHKKAHFDGRHSVGIEEASRALKAYDSSHWVKRIRNAIAEQGRREEALNRRLYGPKHTAARPEASPVHVLPTSRSSPLARATFQDLRFVVSRPSFAADPDGLGNFLFNVGKGMPRDTKFTLLVPLHFSWKMEEARCQLRDYPLPLLHIPPMPPGGGHDHASFEAESDLVIAEEMCRPDAIRRVPCVVVPSRAAHRDGGLYSIVVPRSAMTVKTYATPLVKIRSPYATRVGWGNSVQPAIQDVARVVDTLTRASSDPSERIGFWDKIRLQLHWRIQFLFEGEGPVNIHLKGGRDPYALQGFGAGFVKSWRGNVRLLLGLPNVDREFFQIESSEYVLAIPNLREYVDAAASGMSHDIDETDDRSTQYSGGNGARRPSNQDAEMLKVCAKFTGGVRWGMGAVLERACLPGCQQEPCIGKSPIHRQCRFFDFIHHWDVHTRAANGSIPGQEIGDSFAGFRSDFIHFSISLTSPLTLPLPSHVDLPSDSTSTASVEPGVNSLHFGPQASTHFWAWWRLFDSSMSLPIRQGKLFPSAQPPSKKFGKHCATIKYRFSLAPLFIAHTYRLESWHDWSNGITNIVGLKGKIGRFNVDLHQRDTEEVVRNPETGETTTVRHKPFSNAEVNCDGVDLRVLSAQFAEPEKCEFAPDDPDAEEGDEGLPGTEDAAVHDDDLPWVDLNDFVDALYTIPDRNPKLRILPLLVCPSFTYIRDTDANTNGGDDDDEANDVHRPTPIKNKFGHEPSHTCLMGCSKNALTVQVDSAKHRLEELRREARSSSVTKDPVKTDDIARRIHSVEMIVERLETVAAEVASARLARQSEVPENGKSLPRSNDHEDGGADRNFPHLNEMLYEEQAQEWANRYTISSPAIQVSNSTRQLLLQYYFSQRERKGFAYHMSAKAIKFIRDLAKEHERKNRRTSGGRRKSTKYGSGSTRRTLAFEESQQTNRLLDELVGSPGSFWAANESADDGGRRTFGDSLDVDPSSVDADLPSCFEVRNGHLVSFVKPQISLRSDMDDKSTVIITAFRAVLQVHQVVDLRILDDPINKQVLNKTYGTLQDMQMFYPRLQFGEHSRASFVPLETLLDLRMETLGFDRILPRTSAALRYDKFNQLRITSKLGLDDGIAESGPRGSHFTSGTDRVSVECAQFSVHAEPDHFAAIYNVVTDLLLYTDPHQKSRNQKLEKMVFTTDWSDLPRAADMVLDLQRDLRQLIDVAQEYQVHLEELNEDDRRDLFSGRAHFARLAADLNLVVQSISRAQTYSGSSTGSKTAGIQFEARASELVWHMLDKTGQNFVKFSVKGVEFSWISKQDSSVSNRLIIKDLRALNSAPEHIFAEIISKHDHEDDEHELAKVDVFAAILWNSLAPVGGISIVEQFELHLHPVRLQLEHRIGRKILDYVFSQRRKAQDDDSVVAPPSRTSSLSGLTVPNGSTHSRSTDSLVPSVKGNARGRPHSFVESISPAPSRSVVNLLPSSASTYSLRRAVSAEALVPQLQEEGLDADEMRRRAALNRTFILVDFTSTVLYLTYHSEKEDHSRLPDVYNITYRTPQIQYRNKTWSFLDLWSEVKKDTIKSVWSQKGALLGQLLSSAHRRLPLQDARAAASSSLKRSLRNRLHRKRGAPPTPSEPIPPSSLRIVTQKPTMDDTSSLISSDGEVDNGAGAEGEGPARVFGDSPFVSEPDTMSITGSTSTSRSDSAVHTTEDSGTVDEVQAPSLPILGKSTVARAGLQSRHAASLPPLNHAQPVALEHVANVGFGYPHHQPLPHRSLSKHTEESKAKLLLGKKAVY